MLDSIRRAKHDVSVPVTVILVPATVILSLQFLRNQFKQNRDQQPLPSVSLVPGKAASSKSFGRRGWRCRNSHTAFPCSSQQHKHTPQMTVARRAKACCITAGFARAQKPTRLRLALTRLPAEMLCRACNGVARKGVEQLSRTGELKWCLSAWKTCHQPRFHLFKAAAAITVRDKPARLHKAAEHIVLGLAMMPARTQCPCATV